jgi:hypothetical protein
MEFTIIDNGPWVMDRLDDYLNHKVHIVCVAVNALTTYNSHVFALGEMSHDMAGDFVNLVNDKNETGTLFPGQNMTIVPLSIYGNRNDFQKKEIIRKHILDCIDANEKYVKCSEMIFALERRYDFDIDTFFDEIKDLIKSTSFYTTKKIIYYNN